MNYLLDTNAAIALIKGRPPHVQARFKRARAAKADIFISTIALHELRYGAAKGDRRLGDAENIARLMSSGIGVAPFDADDAQRAGEARAALKAKGTPIGPYDVLIAAQALASDMTLVTANVREFSRVAGLKLENWAAQE